MKIIDWNIVERFVEERKPIEVSAGLLQDWYWTAATVYENGAWTDKQGAYVLSYWATPGFKATMPNGDVLEVEAWREMTPEDHKAHKAERKRRNAQMKELMDKIEAEKRA